MSEPISRASAIPWPPVQAFAFPLFTMMACAAPDWIFSWLTSTGAALTRLVVNTPAAEASESETIKARSGREALMPQCIPAARKPFAAVIPPSTRWNESCSSIVATSVPP